METQTVIHRHHYNIDEDRDRVRLKLIRNSRGYGWEISVSAPTVEEAEALLTEAQARLAAQYQGEPAE